MIFRRTIGFLFLVLPLVSSQQVELEENVEIKKLDETLVPKDADIETTGKPEDESSNGDENDGKRDLGMMPGKLAGKHKEKNIDLHISKTMAKSKGTPTEHKEMKSKDDYDGEDYGKEEDDDVFDLIQPQFMDKKSKKKKKKLMKLLLLQELMKAKTGGKSGKKSKGKGVSKNAHKGHRNRYDGGKYDYGKSTKGGKHGNNKYYEDSGEDYGDDDIYDSDEDFDDSYEDDDDHDDGRNYRKKKKPYMRNKHKYGKHGPYKGYRKFVPACHYDPKKEDYNKKLEDMVKKLEKMETHKKAECHCEKKEEKKSYGDSYGSKDEGKGKSEYEEKLKSLVSALTEKAEEKAYEAKGQSKGYEAPKAHSSPVIYQSKKPEAKMAYSTAGHETKGQHREYGKVSQEKKAHPVYLHKARSASNWSERR